MSEVLEPYYFSYNWNNKLDCKAFTTIRIYNPSKHVPGKRLQVFLNREPKGTGTICEVKTFLLDQLNAYISYLDTGYPVKDCRAVLERMYPKLDFKTKKLALILIVKD